MKTRNILWGLVLVILGIILGINATGIIKIDIFFPGWWTLFMIVPGLIGLISESDKVGNSILVLIGVFLLLASNNIIDFSMIWKLILPAILVIVGLSLIFKESFKPKIKVKDSSLKEYAVTFSSQDLDFTNEEFKSSKMSSIFGSLKCDLRNAKLKDDTVIKVEAIFGSINLIVPSDYQVKITSSSIFGGVNNKTKKKDTKKVLYIEANCLFGGVEVK